MVSFWVARIRLHWLLQAIGWSILLAAVVAAPLTAPARSLIADTLLVNDSPTAAIGDIRPGLSDQHGQLDAEHGAGGPHSCPPGTCATAMLGTDFASVPVAWHARVVAFDQDRALVSFLVSDQFRPPRPLTLARN